MEIYSFDRVHTVLDSTLNLLGQVNRLFLVCVDNCHYNTGLQVKKRLELLNEEVLERDGIPGEGNV